VVIGGILKPAEVKFDCGGKALADVAETGDVEGAVDASCLPGIEEVEVSGDFIDDFGRQGKRRLSIGSGSSFAG